MPRIVHFEIQASDIKRASQFYSSLFGWEITQYGDMEYWGIVTGEKDQPGINGGLLPRKGDSPINEAGVNAYVCTMEVDSLDTYTDKIIAAGGQNVVPKYAIPGVAYLAYYKDTEGNIFGLIENDTTAK